MDMIYSVRRIEYHVFKVRFASDYNQGSRAGEVLPSSRPYPLLSSHEEEYNQSHAVRRIPPHPVFLRCLTQPTVLPCHDPLTTTLLKTPVGRRSLPQLADRSLF